jgi:hypothetical protein
MKNQLKKMSLNEMKTLHRSLESAIYDKECELRKSVKCNKIKGHFILEFGGKKWGVYVNNRNGRGGWDVHKISNGKKGMLVCKEWHWGINMLRLRIANGDKIK